MLNSAGRLGRFVQSLTSSYALLVSNVVYALASVPLALHYLDKSEFGLWAVVTQIFAYLALLDFGMSTSVARLLIDHKDHPDAGVYGSLIKTGWLVSLIQGGVAATLAIGSGEVLVNLLGIDPQLQHEFVWLMRWQGILCLLTFISRMFGHLLYIWQRYDIYNYIQIVQQIVAFVVLWVAFAKQTGVFSMILANAVGWIVTTVAAAIACRWQRCFPSPGNWGKISWQRFQDMFGYGRDVFLVVVGTQLVTASPTILITRQLGLEAAAIWAVCTKTFFLLCQLIWRIFDFSVPALSEMMARGETPRLCYRFRDLVILSASIAGLTGLGFALCNQPFVIIWTSGRIHWSVATDWLLAVWLIVQAVVHCHSGFVVATREVGALRYVSLAEGLVFLGLAAIGLWWGGLPLLIVAGALCNLVLTGWYSIGRTSRYFEQPRREVAGHWQVPMLKVLIVLVPVGLALMWLTQTWLPRWQLLFRASAILIVGGLVWLRLGIPSQLQQELAQRLPPRWRVLTARWQGVRSDT